MSLSERMWDTFTSMIRFKEKLATLTQDMQNQQRKSENLNERLIRVESILDIAIKMRVTKALDHTKE